MSAVASPTHFPITTLRLVPCGETNLQCFYDKPLGRHKDLIAEPDKLVASDYSKIAKAAAEAGIDRVVVAGGEPLLRKDIPAIIKAVCGSKKFKDVRFITNGIFLKDFADALRRSGLKHVEINLDSLNFVVYQKITKRDGLYRVLDGLHKVLRLDFDKIILNVLLLKGVNHSEIVDFAMMTKEEGLEIRLVEYSPNVESNLTKQLRYPALHAKKIIDGFQSLDPIQHHGLDSYRFRDGKGLLSFTSISNGFVGYNEPMLLLDSQGMLSSDLPGRRSHNLVKELARDGFEDRLVRIFQKMIAVQPSKTTPKSKPRARSQSTTRSRPTSSAASV